jgi:hypothetical protein
MNCFIKKINIFNITQNSRYLYLSRKKEFLSNWINGGTVPLNQESNYRNDERKWCKTPDENIQN